MLEIGNRVIDENHPPFIIAEAGINHGGSYEKACRLVSMAKAAGADCVKFQCHIAEAEPNHPDLDIIKKCELTENEEINIKKYCEKEEIIYLSTPFSKEAVDRLEKMNVFAFKIGSGQCNDLSLVEYIVEKGKPIILSTGMSSISEIGKSVDMIQEADISLVIMHCVSKYPTPYDEANLRRITMLYEVFKVPVGSSDHSLGIYTALGAVALGAVALEKHFTVSHSWSGPDISSSIGLNDLVELVNGSKAIWQALKK